MRTILLLVSFALAACGDTRPPLAPAQPKYSAIEDAQRVLSAFPRHAHFSLTGIAYFDSRLFVGSNIGLLEIQNGRTIALHRWYDEHNVLSGPWQDTRNGTLWMQRLEDSHFVSRSASGWSRVGLPKPPGSYYSRGDFLHGFHVTPTAEEPRLIGAGAVWKLGSQGSWLQQPSPPAPEYSATVAYARSSDTDLHVVQIGMCVIPPCEYAVYRFRGASWDKPIPLPIKSVRAALHVPAGLFVLSDHNTLVQVRGSEATELVTPGPAEAIASTSRGTLLASFRGAGVYELDSTWKKRASDPYGPDEEEHWAFLAANDGEIALATTRVPHLKPNSNSEWEYTGTNAVWISRSGEFTRVMSLPAQ